MTKIALIGCGKQAEKHIQGIKAASNDNVEIVLFDLNTSQAAKLADHTGLSYVDNFDALLADTQITAFDICTPTASHLPIIEKALAAGKDFFCEKPLCQSLSEGEKIAELVKKSGHIGMVGYVYRFVPAFEAAKNALDSRALGDVVTASFRIGGRGSHQVWKHRKETGGGALSEMMVHMLDLAIWYFGAVKEVEILVEKLLRPERMINGVNEQVDAEDYLVLRARMESGVEVLLQADMATPAFSQLVEIQGSNGSFFGSIQPDRPSYLFLEKEAGGMAAGRHDLKGDGKNLFETQMGSFIKAIKERKSPAKCTVEDSILILKALDLIQKKKD